MYMYMYNTVGGTIFSQVAVSENFTWPMVFLFYNIYDKNLWSFNKQIEENWQKTHGHYDS